MFDGETGAGESESTPDVKDEPRRSDGEKGDDKEALRRLGEQRDAARTEAQTAKEERDALLREKSERDAAEQKRKDQEAKEAGKFEELATTRERERDEARGDAASLKAENDQLREAITEGLSARIASLPESVRETLNDTFGEDDVLGRWTWLHKPSVLKLIAEKAERSESAAGNRRDPRANGTGKVTNEEATRAQASLYRRF
jgi:hypothetical protein